jgi:hypothetical protein
VAAPFIVLLLQFQPYHFQYYALVLPPGPFCKTQHATLSRPLLLSRLGFLRRSPTAMLPRAGSSSGERGDLRRIRRDSMHPNGAGVPSGRNPRQIYAVEPPLPVGPPLPVAPPLPGAPPLLVAPPLPVGFPQPYLEQFNIVID